MSTDRSHHWDGVGGGGGGGIGLKGNEKFTHQERVLWEKRTDYLST